MFFFFFCVNYVTEFCIILDTSTNRSLHCSLKYIKANLRYSEFNIVTSDEVLNMEPIYDVW